MARDQCLGTVGYTSLNVVKCNGPCINGAMERIRQEATVSHLMNCTTKQTDHRQCNTREISCWDRKKKHVLHYYGPHRYPSLAAHTNCLSFRPSRRRCTSRTARKMTTSSVCAVKWGGASSYPRKIYMTCAPSQEDDVWRKI